MLPVACYRRPPHGSLWKLVQITLAQYDVLSRVLIVLVRVPRGYGWIAQAGREHLSESSLSPSYPSTCSCVAVPVPQSVDSNSDARARVHEEPANERVSLLVRVDEPANERVSRKSETTSRRMRESAC